MKPFIHETSLIDDNVKIGDGTKIWQWCHVSIGAQIGENCTIGQGVFIGKNVVVGNGVKIQNHVSVFEGVTIEDDVFCGPSCVFTNVVNPRSPISRKDEYRPTLVKKGATIGANATIICGNTVGRYAFIGAGSLVAHDIYDHRLAYGVPARVKGWTCECGRELEVAVYQVPGNEPIEFACGSCGKKFRRDGVEVVRKD